MVESQQLWGIFLSCQVPSDLVNLHELLKGPFSSAVTLGHSLEGAHVPSLDHKPAKTETAIQVGNSSSHSPWWGR